MITIIAGSRGISDYKQIEAAVKASGFEITSVLSGGARGADILGEMWAARHDIPCITIKARWETYGAGAGVVRNRRMAERGEALIAVWDGKSPGTRSMIDLALELGLKIYVHEVKL